MPEKVTRGFWRKFFFFLCGTLCCVTASQAQEDEKTVRLKDGTVLHGTFVSDAQGFYRIKTSAL
jgi:hypothetical protein